MYIHPLEAELYYCILYRSFPSPFSSPGFPPPSAVYCIVGGDGGDDDDVDDTFIVSVPFVFPMTVRTFVLYMIVHGLTGVFDHCGIKIELPGVYNSQDHGALLSINDDRNDYRISLESYLLIDNHHKLNNCNYAFPWPYLDLFHGTYVGSFLGKDYKKLSKPFEE